MRQLLSILPLGLYLTLAAAIDNGLGLYVAKSPKPTSKKAV